MGVDVFIVHGSSDKETALRLRDALVQLHVSAFVDGPDVQFGALWDETIDRELRQSLLQVVLFGDAAPWYQYEEIDIAIKEMRQHGAKDRVIPVLLKGHDQLPYGLNRVQALPWDGPSNVAAKLVGKVAALRGARIVDGKLAATQPRVRVAVLGFADELSNELAALQQRIGQRTAILDGNVRRVDLAHEPVPDVDVRVVLLGSRHGGKLELVNDLVRAATRDPAIRDTIVGAINVHLRQVPPTHKVEAADMQCLEVASADSAASVIDYLDDQFAAWHLKRFPSQPGMSIMRERWEDRYLQDKAPLWRKGDPSALRSVNGARIDRVRWYVHLKASQPWVEVEGEIRAQIGMAVVNGQRTTSNLVTLADVNSRTVANAPADLWWVGAKLVPNATLAIEDQHARFFRHHEAEPNPAWLDRVLSHSLLRRCVVVGAAGTGKSVLLQHLAWVLATDEGVGSQADPVHRLDRDGVRGDSPVPPIPVLHTAATLVTHLQTHRPIREALVSLLRSSDTFGDVADVTTLRAGIDAGRYLFLVDSLDEVPLRRDREALVAALGTLTGPTPRVILTTRPSAHTAVELPDGFVRVDIAPLDENAAARLTRAWIDCWGPNEDVDAVLRAVDHLRCTFPAQADERSPVENPLLLSCILQVYVLYRRLPDDTAKLYQDMVRVLCEAKIRAADDHERDTLVDRYREALRTLFLACQELGGTRLQLASAHELLVRDTLAQRGTVEGWLQALANHTGLVRFEGTGEQTVIRPWHRSYQEYLAAEAMALEYANRESDCVLHLRTPRPSRGPRLTDPSWRGTLRFLVGAAVHQNRAWGVNLVNALMAAASTGEPDQARLYALAAEATAEYATTLFQHETLRQILPQAIAQAFAVAGRHWPIRDRIDALEALGRLGDPRMDDPRCGDPENRGWIHVPARRYKVGTRTGSAKRKSTRRQDPLKNVANRARQPAATSISGFWIRRWPATVAEFLPFLQDSLRGSFRRLYVDFEFGIDRALGQLEWQAQARFPTRPVVNVSWHLARAFCTWARQNWQLPCEGVIDLPTADEWESAARRDTNRVFPWGNDEPGMGDTAAAAYAWDGADKPGGPTPVGAFPRGYTPEGIWDMAGNVFEWCASRRGGRYNFDYPIDATDRSPFGYVVYRGGSWCRAPVFPVVRRTDDSPHAARDDVGFRVVCRPTR